MTSPKLRSELRAILKTLESGVKNRLNVSLTPKDCALLLSFIDSILPEDTKTPGKADLIRIYDDLMGKMERILKNFAKDVIEDL